MLGDHRGGTHPGSKEQEGNANDQEISRENRSYPSQARDRGKDVLIDNHAPSLARLADAGRPHRRYRLGRKPDARNRQHQTFLLYQRSKAPRLESSPTIAALLLLFPSLCLYRLNVAPNLRIPDSESWILYSHLAFLLLLLKYSPTLAICYVPSALRSSLFAISHTPLAICHLPSSSATLKLMRKLAGFLFVFLLGVLLFARQPKNVYAYLFACGTNAVTQNQCNAMGGCSSGQRCNSVSFAYTCQTDNSCIGVPAPSGCNNANYGAIGTPVCNASNQTCSNLGGPGVGGGFICVATTCSPLCSSVETCECSQSSSLGVTCECVAAPPPSNSGGTNDFFKPTTCGECPPGDELYCDRYPSIQTALGCIPTHPVAFINEFIDILLGIGGGIAFLLMIVGAVFILTSRGQPEQIQRGKQVFVGALIGLIMIIFSTFLLELIGVDILGIF